MEKERIAIKLCLSGGGFRATFFHLGVVRYLYEAGLLTNVGQICSVSGGSILAAHLGQNWSRYTGSEEEFDGCVRELTALGQADLRGRIVRRWLLSIIFFPIRLLPGRFWKRTLLLERFYSKYLYNNAALTALAGEGGQRHGPDVHLLSTSLTTGFLCAFTRAGFWSDDGKKVTFIRSGLLPLSLGVAASSAFPPLFPPVKLTRRMLDATTAELPYDPEFLTDGGVFDNLGVRKLQRLSQTLSPTESVTIVSDAGAGFDWQVDRSFGTIFTRTIRATDILMKRVGEFERASIEHEATGTRATINCNIGSIVDTSGSHKGLDDNIQKRLGRLRTDLDRFTPREINALTQHGYAVCRDSFARHHNSDPAQVWVVSNESVWIPVKTAGLTSVGDLAQELEKGRSQRPGLWNYSDWASWVLIVSLIFVPVLILGSFALNIAFVTHVQKSSIAVLYVTDRVAATTLSTDFSNQRDVGPLHLGSASISIPSNHKTGTEERPSLVRLEFEADPTRHVALISIKASLEDSFLMEVRNSTTLANGNLIVFVNGFNTTFQESVLSDATFLYDLNLDSAALDFNWPSGAGITDYAGAEEQAEASVGVFPPVLDKLCVGAGIKRISFVARGLGARLTTEILRNLAYRQSGCGAQLGQIILINPDVDVAMFSQVAPELSKTAKHVTIYRADALELKAAKLMHSSPRLGDPSVNLSLPPQIDLVSVPSGKTSARFVHDISDVLHDVPISKRTNVRTNDTSSGKQYTLLKDDASEP